MSVHLDAHRPIPAALGAAAYFFVPVRDPHDLSGRDGLGDVKLAAVMWPFTSVGWAGPSSSRGRPPRLVFYALMLGCVVGVVFGLAVQVATKKRGAFPFGLASLPAATSSCSSPRT